VLKSGDRLLFTIAAVFIAAYFLLLTHASLDAYFTPDDMMNLYRSWSPPIGQLIRSNLLFIFSSTFMRPMGSVWYRTIYDFAGFNPAPFHFANLAILLANTFFTYCVSRRLTGSRLIGALAALLACYHPGLAWLYFDTGYVYDVLCYFFYFAAFLTYLRIRQAGRIPGFWGIAGLIALYVCALNSKEMALTLPVTLLIYELVYHPPQSPRWLLQQGRTTLVLAVLTAAFLIGHMTSSESLLRNAQYQPAFTGQRFMETSGHFCNSLFNQDGGLAAVPMLLVWALLLAIAWVTNSKPLKFAWLFLMLSVAPIAFVPPRGMPQYYIPWFGWTLYLAVVLVSATEYLLRRLPGPVRATLLLAAVAATLFPLYRGIGFAKVTEVTLEAPEMRLIVNQLHGLRPSFPPRARILFLNDPVRADVFDLLFMIRSSYGDNTLRVDRLKTMTVPPDAQAQSEYDTVLDYRDKRFIDATQHPPKLDIRPVFTEFYHDGWTPVTPSHPAKRGEILIAKAADLGPTRPEVPAGAPFPSQPSFAQVRARVDVLVDGKYAEVTNQFGWPGLVNLYRVDFRVPEKVSGGLVKAELVVQGASGPASMLYVQ